MGWRLPRNGRGFSDLGTVTKVLVLDDYQIPALKGLSRVKHGGCGDYWHAGRAGRRVGFGGRW